MSGLFPPSNNVGNNNLGVSNQQQQPVVPSPSPSQSPSSSNNVVPPPSYPLEVKFESRNATTGETRIIAEDLTLNAMDNV